MELNFRLLLLCAINVSTYAQNAPRLFREEVQSTTLNIGDAAPPLRLSSWLKGTPIQKFEKGRVYVIEFWATWCLPCKAAFPHLSALANEYKDKVTIVGVDVYESNTITVEKVKAFVDTMGNKMDYVVAADDSNFMATGWIDASGENDKGIPNSFVVNGEGKLAWIGHPSKLAEVLPKIVNNTWDIQKAMNKRNYDRHLAVLDDSAQWDLRWFMGNLDKPTDWGQPDSALNYIYKMVKDEPGLQYAPKIAFYTFSSLLKTNTHKAYDYGKIVMETSTYEGPALYAIIDAIKLYSKKIVLPEKIYQLGADAYQAHISRLPYPEIVDIFWLYHNMADWLWRANQKSKAIATEKKAIEVLKSRRNFSTSDLAQLELRLQQYKSL